MRTNTYALDAHAAFVKTALRIRASAYRFRKHRARRLTETLSPSRRRGAELLDAERYPELTRPLALLATAIPPSATLNVAIHVVHVLPDRAPGSVCHELIAIAEKNAADALGRCHRTLELDAAAQGYTAGEWLPVVYDIAGPMLQSRLDTEPPTIVDVAQGAISWLSRAVAELDQGSAETATSLAETLARLLALWTLPARLAIARGPVSFGRARQHRSGIFSSAWDDSSRQRGAAELMTKPSRPAKRGGSTQPHSICEGDSPGYPIPVLRAGFSAIRTMDRLLTAEEIAERLGVRPRGSGRRLAPGGSHTFASGGIDGSGSRPSKRGSPILKSAAPRRGTMQPHEQYRCAARNAKPRGSSPLEGRDDVLGPLSLTQSRCAVSPVVVPSWAKFRGLFSNGPA